MLGIHYPSMTYKNQFKNKSTLIIACLAVLCTQAGMMMYTPSMPYLSQIFKVSYLQINYTFTSYVFGYAIAMLFFGGISDIIGRKNGYLITLSIFSLSSFLLISTKSIDLFIFLRLIQGIGGGGCAVIGRASVRDIYEGSNLVSGMSLISMTFNVVMGALQFIGGLIQTYIGYKFDFLCMFFV